MFDFVRLYIIIKLIACITQSKIHVVWMFGWCPLCSYTDPTEAGHHIRQSSDISPYSRVRVKTNGHFTPHMKSSETATQTTPKSFSLSNMHTSKLSGPWHTYCIYITLNGYEKYLDKNNLNIGACSTSSSTLYMLLILGILWRHDCVCLCMLLHFSNAWHEGDKKRGRRRDILSYAQAQNNWNPFPLSKKLLIHWNS